MWGYWIGQSGFKLCILCCLLASTLFILWMKHQQTKLEIQPYTRTGRTNTTDGSLCSIPWLGVCSVWNGSCCEMPLFAAHVRGNSIRVLALLQRSRTNLLNHITCTLVFKDNIVHTTLARGRVIWPSKASHQTVLITCEGSPRDALWVCLTVADNQDCFVQGADLLPVTDSSSTKTNTTNVCTKVVYGAPDSLRLTEWIELNIILGVHKIYMYNSSIGGDINSVLDYYQKLGLLEVKAHGFLSNWCLHRFNKLFPTKNYYLDWELELLSLNDCLYTSAAEYIIVIDIDEILFYDRANKAQSYTELLKTLPEFRYSSSAGFVFRTGVYSNELYRNTDHFIQNKSLYLHTITHNRRTPIDWESPKSIIVRDRCVALGHHICVQAESGFMRRDVKDTPVKIGHVRHYRHRCRLTGEPGKCKKLLSRAVVDNGLKPWEKLLFTRVKNALEKIKVNFIQRN